MTLAAPRLVRMVTNIELGPVEGRVLMGHLNNAVSHFGTYPNHARRSFREQ